MLKTIGIAYKANKLISGEEFVVDAIRKQKVSLVFLANDAGKNTTKRITDKCKYYNVEIIKDFSSDEISSAIGKSGRMVVGITNKELARSIKEKKR
jgi:ribosomal protein L7Ae-like RNA K-turn-binding protein